jgi:hypothetical protein
MNQSSTVHKARQLLEGALIILLLVGLFVVLRAMIASSTAPSLGLPTSSPLPTPTIPIEETPPVTLILKPTPTGIEFATPEPLVFVPAQDSTPAGAGEITRLAPPFSGNQYHIENTWYEIGDGGTKRTNAYVGSVSGPGGQYTEQGVVVIWVWQVIEENNRKDIRIVNTRSYPTPTQSGSVHIIDAVGERLVLQSTNGTTFYFDVPLHQYVPSLTWTPTPAPISPLATPTPTS